MKGSSSSVFTLTKQISAALAKLIPMKEEERVSVYISQPVPWSVVACLKTSSSFNTKKKWKSHNYMTIAIAGYKNDGKSRHKKLQMGQAE